MSFTPLDILLQQVIALSWIRCVQEEGVDFVNKQTGQIESDERIVYDSFQRNLGLFDLPAAKGSKFGLEKNILEVVGGYLLYSDDPQMVPILTSQSFRKKIKDKIEEIRSR